MAQEYKTIKLSVGQSLINLAVQEYGCYEGLFLLVEDNQAVISNIAQVLPAGTPINIRVPVPELTDTNRVIAAKFAGKKLVISSQLPVTDIAPPSGVYQEDVFETGVFI